MNRGVVLCGLGRVGWRVLESLRAMGFTVTAIDLHARPDDPRLAGVTLVVGDCRRPEVLEKAGVQTADGFLVVTGDDRVNVAAAFLARRLNPTARVVVRMFNQTLIARLGGAVRNTVGLSVSALTAPLMALTAVSGESLAAFAIDSEPQQIARAELAAESPLLGRTIRELAEGHKLIVLAHQRADSPARVLHEIDPADVLAHGDRVVVCGAPTAVAPLLGQKNEGIFRGGLIRRLWRVTKRMFGAIDAPVKIASATLFVTLLVSILVFRFAGGDGWADSFFQTVNVAATGSELHGENRTAGVKVFIAGLKLVGAALIAAFTAILTNYLLKARLRGALEEGRIPEGGHVVVCGLGNVGYRCVQELIRLGVKVVAVERTADAPFVPTVRRMGAAVVAGDATVPETLAQARAGTARAVIAATSSELANLEIALLVREQNAEQRVVVRVADADFAQAAREAVGIRHVLSPPALAAPAFATALLGDRVHSLVYVSARTLAVVELVADAGDHLTDRTLHELMIDYRLLPVGLAGAEPFATTGIPKGTRLQVGAKLTAVMELADLERMLRQERPPAEWGVVVDDFPLTAAAELVPLVRTARGCSQEEAAELLKAKPFTLVEGISRGQAEELAGRLSRERVTARVVHRP
jgi:Trk K+ transport system NAD-binding subunit